MGDVLERWCSCVMVSPKHGGPSNPHRPCYGHLPKSLLGTVFGSCQVFGGKQTLMSALGAWGMFASLPRRSWSCWNNHSQGHVALGNVALILHPVTLHPALMTAISEKHGLVKGRLGSVNGEFKACIWGLWSQSEYPTLWCTSCMLEGWMKGWRQTEKWAALSSWVHGAREARKGRGQQENTRMKLNPASLLSLEATVWFEGMLHY